MSVDSTNHTIHTSVVIACYEALSFFVLAIGRETPLYADDSKRRGSAWAEDAGL